MPADNRSFIARYSRTLRKTLATKVLVAFLVRHTLARFGATRRLFHLYLTPGSADDVPHSRLDDGQPVVSSSTIDAAMEAHLRRYDHGLDGCLAPGRLTLTAEVRVFELRDCELMPWLGIVLHRPTAQIIRGGANAQPRLTVRRRAISGRVLSLLGDPRGHNHYYHFFESLTVAMRGLKIAGPGEPITLLVREKLASFQRVTIDALVRRYPHLRLEPVAEHEVVQPERLILARREPCPIICWFALIDEWREIGDMVREAYGPAEGAKDQKLHLSRRHQRIRRLTNEAALEPIMLRHGFRTLAPESLPHRDQVHLILRSTAILSAEGAAITSIIFGQAPLKLILMDPWEILNPFWEGLTTLLGYEFQYVESGKAGWYDAFEVTPEALEKALLP